MGSQSMAVPDRPNQSFFVGGHHFPVYGLDFALGVDVDQGAVQAVAAPVLWTFNDSQINSDIPFFRRSADWIQVPGFDLYGLVQVMGMDLFLDR